MSSKYVILVKESDDAATVSAAISPGVGANSATSDGSPADELSIERVAQYVMDKAHGGRGMGVYMWDTGVSASATFTIASGNLSGGDSVTVGGVTLTAGTDFTVGASALLTAKAIATAVNAKSTLYGIVLASAAAGAASSGVVTFTSVVPGNIGNLIALSKSATNGSVSAAALSGGSQAHKNMINAGLAYS